MPSNGSADLSIDRVERLLVGAREGEGTQLGILLDLYRRYLLSVATQSLATDVSVKIAPSDLVQETFLEAASAFSKFKGETESEVRAWLTQILNRNLLDAHRHFRSYAKRDISREVSLHDREEPGSELFEAVTCIESPSARARVAEDVQLLQNALNTLDDDQRQVIQLRSIEQIGFEEIGKVLKRSPDAARKLWIRALEKLTAELRLNEPDTTRPL